MLQYVLIVIGVWLIVQIVIGTRQLKKQQDAMMQQMQRVCASVGDSWNRTIPMIKAPTAPMPVQIA